MRASERRVVVTGVGLVTPIGVGVSATWSSLLAAQGGIAPISRFDSSAFSVRIAGEVKGFDPLRWIPKRELRRMDRFIQFAMAAACEAVESAGLSAPLGERAGVHIGVGLCGLETIEIAAEVLRKRGPRRISPFMIPRLIANLAPGQVSIRFGAQGPNLGSVSACSTGAHSLGEAAHQILRGEVDLMLAGGCEATITPLGIAGFAALRALSTRNEEPERACRPFDADRDGFGCAEGSAILVLEELEFAQRRGAPILAELLGYGQASDAFHMTQPEPSGRGARRAMSLALQDAELPPEAVGYINAHGTSTPLNDLAETRAIRGVFGAHADTLWVSSSKSMTGHMLGAAGAVEAAITVLSLKHSAIPPTINYKTPDPDCDLDYVPNEAREARFQAAMSNSFGFGGSNVSLLFGRWPK